MNEADELLQHYKTELMSLKPKYIFAPTGNPDDFAVAIVNRPNIFFRLFQRALLGFRYIPINTK